MLIKKRVYKAGSFAVEIIFQDKWLLPILKFNELNLYNIIVTKAAFSHFAVLKIGVFVEKFEEHKAFSN